MTAGVPDSIELVEYGRSTGLFPDLASATPMTTLAGGVRPNDSMAFLHRESGRSGVPWTDTPTLIKSLTDPALTPFAASITGSSIVVGNLLDVGLYVWRPVEGREWRLTAPATPVLMRVAVERTRAVEEFSVLSRRIRAVAGLTVPEFARLFERSREAYYQWLRNGPTKEARARAEALSEVLEALSGQAAHRNHDWLFANGGARFELLVAEDYAGFREQAEQWITPTVAVSIARPMTMDEVDAMAKEEPSDAGQRYRAYLASMRERPVTPVRASPNFYRDLLASDEDEDE